MNVPADALIIGYPVKFKDKAAKDFGVQYNFKSKGLIAVLFAKQFRQFAERVIARIAHTAQDAKSLSVLRISSFRYSSTISGRREKRLFSANSP